MLPPANLVLAKQPVLPPLTVAMITPLRPVAAALMVWAFNVVWKLTVPLPPTFADLLREYDVTFTVVMVTKNSPRPTPKNTKGPNNKQHDTPSLTIRMTTIPPNSLLWVLMVLFWVGNCCCRRRVRVMEVCLV